MDNCVLILGGAGFIGSNIIGEFLGAGARVTVLDGFVRHTGANIKNISPYLPKITFRRERIEQCKDLERLIRENDLIIDCMALTSHNIGMDRPLLDVRTNLIPHVYLIQALKHSSGKKVIYLGSRGQYGKAGGAVITEETPMAPIDAQGIDKTAAEYFFKIYSGAYGFRAVSLRVTNCFGENQKIRGEDIGLVGSFIRDILTGKTVEIYGGAERKKNIVYAGDLAGIVGKVADIDIDGFEAFNVSGHGAALSTILDAVIDACGKGAYMVKPFPERIRKIDVGGTAFSSDKLQKVIGEIRLTDIGTSMRETVGYFRNRMGLRNALAG